LPIKHALTSAVADSGVAGEVSSDEWNADHIGGFFFGAGTPIRFLAASGGNDSNDGLSPTQAKATAAGAYSSLPSTGGSIMLLPGRHDVTTGLVLTKGKRLAIYGLGHWQRSDSSAGSTWASGGGAVLFTSEATPPTKLISWTVANDNEEGFTAKNVIFECKDGVENAIYADSVNHGIIEDCAFFMKDATAIAIVLDNESGVTGDDASWWRVKRNNCIGARFFDTVGPANHNGIILAENVVFHNGARHISIQNGHRCIIRENNVEGDTTGPFIELLSSDGCRLDGNSGECSTAGNIFIQLDASHGNLLSDIGTSTPSATDVLYSFINGSQDNLALISPYTQSGIANYGDSTMWSDSDSQGKNYRIATGSAGALRENTMWLPKIKSGDGTPESVVFGYPGDIFLRGDGGAGTAIYVKETGSNTTTGWFPLGSQVSGALQLRNDISPAQLTANTDNWAPTGIADASRIRFSTDASRDITGITTGADGRVLILHNIGTANAVLKHDVTSTAANRFLCPNSVDFTLGPNESAELSYDAGSSRWRVLATRSVLAHEAAADPHAGYATDSDLTTHAAAGDPHTGYRLESQSGTFTVGGSILSPTDGMTIIAWRAPFACTVTDVHAQSDVGTTAIVNAGKGFVGGTTEFCSTDITIDPSDAWEAGTVNQNQSIAAGDAIYLEVVDSGTATQITIQVTLSRP
jgi:hypothetical protein